MLIAAFEEVILLMEQSFDQMKLIMAHSDVVMLTAKSSRVWRIKRSNTFAILAAPVNIVGILSTRTRINAVSGRPHIA